jgi:cytochrome b
MPNLLPDWTLTLPWDLGDFNTRAAGRLIWSIFLTIVGIAIVVTMIKQPGVKRPFPSWVGYVLFPVIIVGTLVLGALIPSLQRTIILAGIGVLVAHTLLMVASRTPRDMTEEPATWAECILGAVGVFALMALAYAIVPHEWLTFANADLEWGESSKFVFTSNDDILGFIPIHYPFALDFPALRDIVVTFIYVAFLGLNLKLFVMWQQRNEVPAETEATEPSKLSRFGRPLRAMRHRGASPEPAAASAAPAEGG